MLRLALAAVAATSCRAADPASRGPAPEASDSVLAITHVTVVDVAAGTARPEQTVLVSGARITAVGPAGAVAVPGGARRVDGRGRWLIPGLWDMHVHTSRPERELELYLRNGITGVRDMGGEAPGNPTNVPGSFSAPWSELRAIRDGLRRGTVRGPRMIAAGVMFDAPQPWPGTLGVASPEAARRAVVEWKEAGVDFIKIGSGVTREAFRAIAYESRQVGLPFAGHAPGGMMAVEVADAGQRSIEHLTGLPGDCFEGDSPGPDCTGALAHLARSGVTCVPTLVAWRGRLLGDAPPDAAARKANERMFAAMLRVTAAMRSAGIPVLAGTDSGNPHVDPGVALHAELRLLADAGFSPRDALAAATVGPARFLGLTGELGNIVPGKRADLVLLEGDPLRDIRNSSRIAQVILNGRVVSGVDPVADPRIKAYYQRAHARPAWQRTLGR